MDRERDPEEERRERDRFVLLQHVYSLAHGDPARDLTATLLCSHLGFLESEAAPLLRELVLAGYLAEQGTGPRVSLTPKGIDYVERSRGRRRSIRLAP